MKAALSLASAFLVMSGTAVAQGVAPAAADPQPQPPAQPAGPEATEVSGQEVEQFALAALVIEEEQKQAAMLNAVQQAGLEPRRFNQIAQASQTDQELQERIQVAAAQHVEAAQQNQ